MLKPSAKIFYTYLSQRLPDDRPITAIQIVEHTEKCPEGFVAISRTHDQDQDADLWREHSLFMRKQGRYLCLSKTEGLPNYVVQEIAILGDKELPPEGFSLLHRTADSEQKAWRKRQIVYRLTHIKNTTQAITDIIVCSRLKQAPTGFTLAGEINGVTVCYKMGPLNNPERNEITNNITNGNGIKNGNGSPFMGSRAPPELPPKPFSKKTSPNTTYPILDDTGGGDGDHDYERLNPSYLQPSRPAPKPPAPQPPRVNVVNGFSTLAIYNSLEGVPFVLNPKLVQNGYSILSKIPPQKPRSMLEIEKDYAYDFNVERQT